MGAFGDQSRSNDADPRNEWRAEIPPDFTLAASSRPISMRWILLLPLALGCDRVRAPAKTDMATDSVHTVVAARDTTPVVAPVAAFDSTVVAVSDSALPSMPDSVAAAGAQGVAAVRRELVIPAELWELPPVPENEPMDFDGEGGPVLPHVNYGDCEGDRCSAGFVALSCLATALRSDARVDAPISARIPDGELLQARRDLHLQESGVVIVKQDFVLDWDETATDVVARADTVSLAEGDTVHVLRYLERGRWTWAYRGRLHDSGEFWATTYRNGSKRMESEYAVRRSLPRRELWWKVTRLDGTSGWWLQSVSGERSETEAHDELQPVSGRRNAADDCARVKARRTPGAGRRGPVAAGR
jgi:hypothetical protein